MAVNFSPIFNSQSVDSSGAPASGWKVYSYVANSATPLATYTTEAGDVEQSNPVVLNSLGFPTTGQIWLTANTAYKLVLTNAADVVQKTEDNILGVPDIAATSEWVVSGLTPTYISATSFSLAGDQTTAFNVGRRLKTTNTGGTIYSRIKTSSFASATTTITLVNDSGTLDSGLSAVSYGLLSATNPSTPVLTDAFPVLSGSADKTKLIRFEVDGLTTDTTRVITVPDADITLGNWSTGDVKLTWKTTADSGWIMAGDGSIGNAASGATARANADTEALFTLMWTNVADAQAPVSSGRGASAAADFAANKTLTMPAGLGRALGLSGAGSGLTSRAIGLATGTETHTLTGAQSGIAQHTHTQNSHTHTIALDQDGAASGQVEAKGTDGNGTSGSMSTGGTAATNQNAGPTTAAEAHPIMQPTLFLNAMVKL